MVVVDIQPSHQWLFSIDHLSSAPTTLDRSLPDEMADRARGVEFLYRLGTSIGLHAPGIFTAATWFHRFFMRYSMQDYHRQHVAASCIFLATKTEECGRKLKDVARVYCAKTRGTDVREIADNGKEVQDASAMILETEEVLLEALCFDFVIEAPHATLVSLFEAHEVGPAVIDYAWSIAHDSYRTPLCVLHSPTIIGIACYVLAQCVADGPHSISLDARISSTSPSASLPTPPTHKPGSPDVTRFAIEFFGLNGDELSEVAECLDILLEFYRFQASLNLVDHLTKLTQVPPPTSPSPRLQLYPILPNKNAPNPSVPDVRQNQTPDSNHGNSTPVEPVKTSRWAPITGDAAPDVRRE